MGKTIMVNPDFIFWHFKIDLSKNQCIYFKQSDTMESVIN